jgi:formylglycine-generating enzyme required for sulfatase activity
MPNLSPNRRLRPDAEAVCAVIGMLFEWCDVRDGEFFYGQNQTRMRLPSFQIAKYPISYDQFQVFVDANDGFFDLRWWEGLACDSNHQAEPGQQQFPVGDHPRENVSWYDAIAFCRWLSYRLNTPYDLSRITEWAVRLPTVFEWERAARGTDDRLYPYEGAFNSDRCNTRESRKRQTTPVNTYERWRSPVGAVDMCGNVFEWCLSQAVNPAHDAVSENMAAVLLRSVRGGSWHHPQEFARLDHTGLRCLPDDRGQEPGAGQVGFRIVCSI